MGDVLHCRYLHRRNLCVAQLVVDRRRTGVRDQRLHPAGIDRRRATPCARRRRVQNTADIDARRPTQQTCCRRRSLGRRPGTRRHAPIGRDRTRRRRDDPLHLGHNRLTQGCGVHASRRDIGVDVVRLPSDDRGHPRRYRPDGADRSALVHSHRPALPCHRLRGRDDELPRRRSEARDHVQVGCRQGPRDHRT